jgi:hypothetical protein
MIIIGVDIELQDYIKRIERQTEVLILSPIFTDEDRKQIQSCFDDLIKICNARLVANKDNNPKIENLRQMKFQ